MAREIHQIIQGVAIMPPQGDLSKREAIRKAIRKARKITAMLQGTMGLEGQGLDPKFLRISTVTVN